ncbi:MAG: permease [Bacillota bacterium]
MAVIVGMLTTAMPWGPIMAFLTSSPLMSPDGFVMIAGLISLRFAVALTTASLVIGVSSGFIAQWIERHTGFLRGQTRSQSAAEAACGCQEGEASPGQPAAVACGCAAPLPAGNTCGCVQKQNVKLLMQGNGGSACCAAPSRRSGTGGSRLLEKIRMHELLRNLVDLGLKQILLYFSVFIAVGYLVNAFVPASIVSALLGADNLTAVPLAALIGLPLYLTTESSIPLINSLLQSGASEGAMLAFIISGSATSAWVIAGLATFIRKRALGLYVACIMAGSIVIGYLYDAVLAVL